MEQQILNPKDGIYPATNDYAHGICLTDAKKLVFVAGTMGLDNSGKPALTLEAQLDLIWNNIRRILADAGMTTNDIVRVTSYLTKPEFADQNAAARIVALGNRRVPTTAIIAGTLSEEWLVEIEVIAAQ